jgi:hypothetical protein
MGDSYVCRGRFFSRDFGSENCDRDQALVRAQNHEFDRVIKEASEISQQTAAATKAQEDERARQMADEQARIATLRTEISNRAAEIPPEPANGVAIAVCFPDLRRTTRKFGREQSADDIFALVANNPQMFDASGIPLKFRLALAVGGVCVDRSQTLAEQGLTRRTLLHVELDDED